MRLVKLMALAAFIVITNVVTVVLLTGGPASSVGPPPCVPGDANGDGSVDVSDPIALLGFIFQGGPAPVACATSPTQAVSVGGPGTTPGFTNIQWGVEYHDPCDLHEDQSDTLILSPGTWLVCFRAFRQAPGPVPVELQLDGQVYAGASSLISGGTEVTTVMSLSANSEVTLFNNSPSPLPLASGLRSTELWAVRIGD